MSGSIPTSSISFLGIVNAYNNVNTTDLPTTNISLSSFRSKSFSDSTSVPSSGAISINSHFKGKTWMSDGSNIPSELESIRSTMSGFSNTNTSSIISTLEGQGYTVFATPKYGAMAESMGEQNPVSSGGKFYRTYFDNANTIANSSGFSNSTLNGYPWYGFALYVGSTFKGFGVMMFRDYNSAAVKDFFYPTQWRNLYTYVLNANGTTIEDVGGSTRTHYSNGSSPGTNGYNSTTRFSADDGVWGMCIGRDVDGNSPGPHLSGNAANSYGIENYNSGDGNSTLYWNGSISSSDYTMYCFTKSSTWTLLFRQTIGYWWSSSQSLSLNSSDPNNDNYSILDQIDTYKNTDGKYRLRYVDTGDSASAGQFNDWRQTSNFTTTSNSVSGYEAVSVYDTGSSWGGLCVNGYNSYSRFDGSPGSTNWWFAVGTIFSTWSGGRIPGLESTSQMEIYIMKEN